MDIASGPDSEGGWTGSHRLALARKFPASQTIMCSVNERTIMRIIEDEPLGIVTAIDALDT